MRPLLRWTGLLLALLASTVAEARRYPITVSDASGTWVAGRRALLHGVGELWKRYGRAEGLPADEVNDLELDTRSVWVATPRGLARLDKGSRRWETFAAGALPASDVTSVSADPSDPDQVWVGTRAGLANYNIRTNAWTRFGVASGLPSALVHDVLYRGQTVWIATDAGLAAYDLKLRSFTIYKSREGLAGDRVLEIDEIGTDLWLTCDGGLSRMSLQRRSFVTFTKKQGLPGTQLLSLARQQNLIYFVTDGGLITYDTSADALTPFLHTQGLLGARVTSVATAGGFIWFGTDKGLARFEPNKKTWERYKQEDGLSSEDLGGLTAAGNFLMVFGARGELDSYDYKKDEWVDRSSLVKVAASQPAASGPASREAGTGETGPPKQLKLSFSAELNTELKQDLRWPRIGPNTREGYWLVNTLRLGAGAQWASGRTLDFSGNLDWGDVGPAVFEGQGASLKSFQRYDLQLRYLGLKRDLVEEVILSDKLRLEPLYEGQGGRQGLLERTEVEGGRVVLGAGPSRSGGRFAKLEAAAGIRRGTPLRVVLRRPEIGSLQIKRFKLLHPVAGGAGRDVRYVIPASVRAVLDGRELERNVDYFVDHENGVLWLKNTDLAHTMRVLEVELEYEQIPRKNVGAVSMTDLIPRDGDIGKIKRSGPSRWAKDEQGLFDEIDGGAEQYINRGWTTTLSQDLEWGSAGIILRIHDMEDDKNARSIFLARKLPEAKPVPGLEDVFLEKQSASLSIKLVRGKYFIEVSIDQATMEQEILSIAGWLVGKLQASGSTSADALRDVLVSAGATFRFTDQASLGVSYLGTRSLDDADVKKAYNVAGRLRDLVALSAAYNRRLGQAATLSADFQAAASSAAEDGSERASGNGLQGSAQLQSKVATVRLAARKYSDAFQGIGVARQTEFCRAADGDCTKPKLSRLDYEAGLDATVRPREWLPLSLVVQRQSTRLGADYTDVQTGRTLRGTRDLALGQIALDKGGLPKLFVGGGYLRRDDAHADQDQLRGAGGLEMDLASTWLKKLRFKKIYLRGLYEIAQNTVDEFRIRGEDERDRVERMQHAVGELRLAPTLTESGYATLEYQGLRGAVDADGRVLDQLTYWRLDAGAGSSILPGIAVRFDSTLWFGDDQPLPVATFAPSPPPADAERKQEASSTLAGVVDLFPGRWIGKLGPLKLNTAYTYSLQGTSRGLWRGAPPGLLSREICDNGVDDDGDGAVDCTDTECALADACLLRTGQLKSHRVYGTLSWDTPGKLQAEVFGDLRKSYSDRDDTLRSTRVELRSYVTWRPIYPSPVTLRFDLQSESKRPDQYDALADPPRPEQVVLEPALEWRRRWSPRWWHLAKLTVSHARTRDLPHVRTEENIYGKKGDLERLDYDETAFKPSLEIRRRFEDERSTWSFRPYVRASAKLQWGKGVRSRIDDVVRGAEDPGLANGSETSRTYSLSLGLIWVHSDHVFVDLDLTASYYDCVRAPSGSFCNDNLSFSPHLLATARY